MPEKNPPTGAQRPKRQIWTDSHVAALVEGTMEDRKIERALQSKDSRGMDPTTFAALRAAKMTGDLLPLLDLLNPPEAKEQTQIEKVLDLLEAMAAAIARIEQQQAALVSQIAARPAA